MSRKHRQSKREPNRQATRRGPTARTHQPAGIRASDQALVNAIRTALRSGEVLAVPTLASAMARQINEMNESADDLRVVVDALIEIDVAEATAMLHALAPLLDDDVMRAAIRRELATRRHPVPDSIAHLSDLTVVRALAGNARDELAEDMFLELEGPGVRSHTAIVFVDLRFIPVLRDAFIVPTPYDEVLAYARDAAEAEGYQLRLEPVSAPDVRARIENALEGFAELSQLPWEESETWPDLEPIVRLIARTLPEGGVGYDELSPRLAGGIPDSDMLDNHIFDGDDFDIADDLGDLSEEQFEQLERIAHGFLDGTAEHAFGERLDLDEEAVEDYVYGLAHVLAEMKVLDDEWPDVWDATVVTELLNGPLSVALSGDPNEYALAPEVVRQFLLWSHQDASVSAAVTMDALRAVDDNEADFERLRDDPMIVSIREQAGLIVAGEDVPGEFEIDLDADAAYSRYAGSMVGGQEALAALDDAPLPDEPLQLDEVADDIRDRVARVAALTDHACNKLVISPYDVEARTACRRLLVMIAVSDPATFRRRLKDETIAASVLQLIAHANRLGFHMPGVGAVSNVLGVASSLNKRKEELVVAAGIDLGEYRRNFGLQSADLLESSTRSRLIASRDAWQEGPA